MKNAKLNSRRLMLLAVLAVLTLLLTMCAKSCSGRHSEESPALAASTVPVETTVQPVQTEETTTPAPETTAATEAATEPTESTTEPSEETEPEEETEATTAPTTDPEEEEDVVEDLPEIPEPGTPENPYVEVVETYPAQVESVTIPADMSISYLIAGSAGSVITIENPGVMVTVDETEYTADEETGIVTVDLSKDVSDPVVHISHIGTEPAACVLKLEEGLGGAGCPEILEDPVETAVKLPEGDANGYHYLWISTITGQVELTLKEEEIPEETTEETVEQASDAGAEETEPAEEEPVLEIIVTVGEQSWKLSECEDGKLCFDVSKAAEVLIQVIAVPFEDGTYPEITETVLWTLLPALGTEENPEPIESSDSGFAIPVTLEENDPWGRYYLWTAGVDGELTLTATPEDLDVTATLEEAVHTLPEGEARSVTFHMDMGQTALLHAIAASPEEEDAVRPVVKNGKITGTMAPDPGSPENPAVLDAIDTISVSLEEGDSDGYTFRWTAKYDGTLTLQSKSTAGFDVVLTNTVSGETVCLSEAEAPELTLAAKAEDVLTILIIAVPDEAGQYAAGEIDLTGVFLADPGSSPENPIEISDPQSGISVSFQARQTLYFSGMLHEMIATVEDGSGVSIRYAGATSWGNLTGTASMKFSKAGEAPAEEPVVFSVTSKHEKELTISFAYPSGHAQNPAALVMGKNPVALEEGDEDGYLFRWTAECDGMLTVAVNAKSRWQCRIENLSAGTETVRSSEEDSLNGGEEITVKAGDQLHLCVKTLDPKDPSRIPAGSLTVTASFHDPLLGTEAKPISLETGSNTVNTVTVPAGQTHYYSVEADGMVLHFRGQYVTVIIGGAEYTPEKGMLELLCQEETGIIAVRNDGNKDQKCRISFAYPVGHRKNPMALVMGENIALLEDGNIDGCTFTWTADCTGLLTITMAEDAVWQYVLWNDTAHTGGVVHTSEDQPQEPSETIEVTAGDRILVSVNTFDLEHPLHTPAGEVSFEVSFVDPTLGEEENPVWLNQSDEIIIPAGKSMYCTAKADGMILTLKGTNVTVEHNGVIHLPVQNEIAFLCEGAGTFEHPEFVITNTGTEDGVYSIRFDYPLGHFLNPAPLKPEKNTAVPEPNSETGCYFLWTADVDGMLRITMEAESGWAYSVSNLTAGINGETHFSDAQIPVRTETICFRTGDQIRIIVNSHDPSGMGETPGGEIVFTAEMIPAEMPGTEPEPEGPA